MTKEKDLKQNFKLKDDKTDASKHSRDVLTVPSHSGAAQNVSEGFKRRDISACDDVMWCDVMRSPPPSSPQTDPSALWPGHLWDQTGRCSRRSSWRAPPVRPRCSRGKLRDTTCWTGERGRTSRTCPSSPGPCSYLRVTGDSYNIFKMYVSATYFSFNSRTKKLSDH